MLCSALIIAVLATTEGDAAPSIPNCPDGVVGAVGADAVADPKAKVQAATVKSRVEAIYPAELKPQKLQAKVIVEGTIDVDGNVGDVTTSACKVSRGGKPLAGEERLASCAHFTAAAKTAYASWLYAPARTGGQAMCTYVSVAFSFTP